MSPPSDKIASKGAASAALMQHAPSLFDASCVASDLLRQLGHPRPQAVIPMPGGRNNQVWRVECGCQSFLLKRYFWSEQDPRDRLGQEWEFLQYLRKIGCGQAPVPLARNPAARCALLEFIAGVPLEVTDVTAKDVDAAANFFIQMNSQREQAGLLRPVSEACFSIASHLVTTATRVERLEAINPDTETHATVRDFVKKTVRPLWRRIDERIRSGVGSDQRDELPLNERCISPSDFGFHNTLRQSDGTLRFLDFEYAGWDDPAKTIIDFCNQPDRLLPVELARVFCERSTSVFPSPSLLQNRIAFLEPLYQLKWACICLNNFLPGRAFTDPRPDRFPEAQLTRARTMAGRSSESLDALPPNT